ncbi:MAG: cell division protein SepF [Candidatus Nanoarchaeia archaeon]|nr:cell division protein SepF [Candidatus Nanoarchaeia archaeon]MDD5054086.1 cell division protein SepF [Candidatus Nanoarchaeia archaeon]MDD5499524.1 cell division protein SepF [Candidatus Nanoarchaeia archaeon]
MVFDKIKKFAEKLAGTTRISYDDEFTEFNGAEEIIEVKPSAEKEKFKVYIKYMHIEDSSDVKKILDYVREGNFIVLANYKKLKDKDSVELRRSIDKIKRTCEAVNGDVVGLEEYFILIYPGFATISKEEISK